MHKYPIMLILALIVPAGLIIAEPLLAAWLGTMGGAVAGQIVFALLLVMVIGGAFKQEAAGRAEFGFAGTGRWTLPLAALVAIFLFFGYRVIAYFVIEVAGLPGKLDGADPFYDLPFVLQITDAVLISAGLYWLLIAYAIERLKTLTGSGVLAILLPTAMFSLPHWMAWGPGPTVTLAASTLILTLVYLWRRDVLALMLADLSVDIYGILQSQS